MSCQSCKVQKYGRWDYNGYGRSVENREQYWNITNKSSERQGTKYSLVKMEGMIKVRRVLEYVSSGSVPSFL